MSVLSDQVAKEWFEADANGYDYCGRCVKKYQIARPGGPSVVCPNCGFTVPDERCARLLASIGIGRRKKMAVIEAAEDKVADDSPRCDPPRLGDVIGNAPACLQIRTALDAHRARGGKTPFPHLILCSPGGCGKTMLAEIIAREIKKPIRLQMGQTLNTPAKVSEMLLSLKSGDVLYIDEAHQLRPNCQEALYRAMEDGIVVPSGKAIANPIKLPPFTLIASTTDSWGLLPSLLQRFKYSIQLERMSAADLAMAISHRAERKQWKVSAEAAGMIADRAHGTPRLAISLLDGCMDTAIAGGADDVDAMIVEATCSIWRIDSLGLDNTARKYLQYLADANGPLRLNVLSSKLQGLSRRTIETRVEPELVYLELITKDADGRRLTAAGRQHLKGGAN